MRRQVPSGVLDHEPDGPATVAHISSPDGPGSALEHLLLANAATVEDLDLPMVLRQVLAAARELVHARSGSVGVIGPDGDLEQVARTGMDEAAGSSHGHLSRASSLDIAILVRGQVFGNLYLAGSTRGGFTAQDERLAIALAGTASSTIAGARLAEQTRHQRRWLNASAELTQSLLANSARRPLDLLVGVAMRASGADMAMVSVPITDHTGRVDAATGALVGRAGQIFRLDHTLAGRLIRSPVAAITHDGAAELGRACASDLPDGVGDAIGVALPGPDETVRGALIVAHARIGPRFTESDREQLIGFAVHAGVVLDLASAREDHETLRQIEDHDRIAADLRDHVIEELFATGLGLQGMVGQLTQPTQRARVLHYIQTLDDTIRTIRNTIYHLDRTTEKHSALTTRLIAVLAEQTDSTDLALSTEFEGHLDQLPSALNDDILAVLRESVSNTVRHAGASTMTVALTSLDDVLTLEVTDNGVGIARPTDGRGLADMRSRAANHAGALRLSTPVGGGSRLTWTAHHTHPDAPHEAA